MISNEKFRKQLKEVLQYMVDNQSDAYTNEKLKIPYFDYIWEKEGIDIKLKLADYGIKKVKPSRIIEDYKHLFWKIWFISSVK